MKIVFSAVYLSDLTAAYRMFRQRQAAAAVQAVADWHLTFGLPLVVARLENQVIAYASVHVENTGVIAVNTVVSPVYEQEVDREKMLDMASKQLLYCFDPASNGTTTVKNVILRLNRWLADVNCGA
ncbi:hypothetical protein ACL9RF_02850 [Sphingobacterium sp. Mn56C]|uniref:hypothetical protein n=1 Tax=Sphingobacterium sp. Mn56C TaxID=3395261 RepID=UPI003BEBDD10